MVAPGGRYAPCSFDGSSAVASGFEAGASGAGSAVSGGASTGGGAAASAAGAAVSAAVAAGTAVAGAAEAAPPLPMDEPRPLASVLSVSTPPASWTVWNAPTAMTIASTTPIQAQIVASSPRIVSSLMTAKMRISTPMTAADIAVETGSGILTDAIRTISHANRMIVRMPRITPAVPYQPFRE